MLQLIRKILSRLRPSVRQDIHAKVAVAFARAAATAATRTLDPEQPRSWEFSGFSQHGEDGIIDCLCGAMTRPNRFFVEIGSADGLQNCSAWLAYARRFGGVMVEADPKLSARNRQVIRELNCHNVSAVREQVDRENVAKLMLRCPYREPDVLIIDIDGIDFHVLDSILRLGFKPALLVVEYNSAYGPEQAITVPYTPQFNRRLAHPSRLYYGASIAAWRTRLERKGYRFVTVDSNGVNAFFIHPDAFPARFADAFHGLEFQDNLSDRNGATEDHQVGKDWCTPLRDWRTQFAMICDLDYDTVDHQDE